MVDLKHYYLRMGLEGNPTIDDLNDQYKILKTRFVRQEKHEDISVSNKAKENLTRIEEHYKYYVSLHSHKRLTKAEIALIAENAKSKPWFSNSYPEGCIIFETDAGVPCQIYAPWCGYFESLNEAEIIEDSSDRKISFR